MIQSRSKFLKPSKITSKTLTLELCSSKKWKVTAYLQILITVQLQNLYTNLPVVICSTNAPLDPKERKKGTDQRRGFAEKSAISSG